MGEVLRGDLDGVSLASVLQLVELECFCGELRLARGALTFHNGALVDGRFLGLAGADAAVEALVRGRGAFALHRALGPERSALAQVPSLVIESCRLQDELERVGAAPARVVDAAHVTGELSDVCDALGRASSVAAAIAASGAHVVRVMDPLLQAVERGALSCDAPTRIEDLALLLVGDGQDAAAPIPSALPKPLPSKEPTPSAPHDDRSFDDLVFDARRLVRDRLWEDAEAALRRALEIRPGSKIVAQNLSRVRSLRAAT